jgi:hypothetical protein
VVEKVDRIDVKGDCLGDHPAGPDSFAGRHRVVSFRTRSQLISASGPGTDRYRPTETLGLIGSARARSPLREGFSRVEGRVGFSGPGLSVRRGAARSALSSAFAGYEHCRRRGPRSSAQSLVSGLVAAVRGGGDSDSDTVRRRSTARRAIRQEHRSRPLAAEAARLAGSARGTSPALAIYAVQNGRSDPEGWPSAPTIPSYRGARRGTGPHPDDPGGLLGAVGALRPGVADAVVSLCGLGSEQAARGGCARGPRRGVARRQGSRQPRCGAGDRGRGARGAEPARGGADGAPALRARAESDTGGRGGLWGADHGGQTAEALRRVAAELPSAHPRPSLVAALA